MDEIELLRREITDLLSQKEELRKIDMRLSWEIRRLLRRLDEAVERNGGQS